MSIRFFNPQGQSVKGRRTPVNDSVSSFGDNGDEHEGDLQKLAQVIRDLLKRVSVLESDKQPDAVEFDQTCPAAGTFSLTHGFGCPIRWWVVSWRKSSAAAPILTEVGTSSDQNTLVLTSGVTGQAVIRIEKSQFGQSPV